MKHKTIKWSVAFTFLVAGLISACELTAPIPFIVEPLDIEDIVYSEHIQPIFDARCVSCHVGADAAGGLRLDSWDNVIAGSRHGEAVIPYDDENSYMMRMVTSLVGGPHPLDMLADTLTANERNLIQQWIIGGAKNDADEVPYEDSWPLLFVPNEDNALISVIDPEALLVIRTVDLTAPGFDYTPNARPYHIALDPSGQYFYVSLAGDNKVIKINRDYNFVGEVDFESPGLLAIHPESDTMYVSRAFSAVNPPQSIGVIRRSDMSLREIAIDSEKPHALIVDPLGKYVHTGTLIDNLIVSIDTGTEESTFFRLRSPPAHALIQFAMASNGNRIVVTGDQSDQAVILDSTVPPGIVRIGSLELGPRPGFPVFTPNDRFVYIASRGDNTVTVVDMDVPTVTAVISDSLFAEPYGTSVSPDGEFVFVSNLNESKSYRPRHDFGTNSGAGTVAVISTATNEVIKVIEVGRTPSGLSEVGLQ